MKQDFKILNFTMFCISSVAASLGKSLSEIYRRMQECNIIDDYIIPCYEVLHTFSREYIVDDLVLLMQKRGAL
jgi:hypothetical protein